jgi:hypothetical protein
VTYFTGFGVRSVKTENNGQYHHVRGDCLLENAKECKEPEDKQILMLCLLLSFLFGGVVSEGFRIYLDFNVCSVIQMFSDWGSLAVLILPSLQVSIVSFKVSTLGFMHWAHHLCYSWEIYTLGTASQQLLEASLKLLLCDAIQQLDLLLDLSCISLFAFH